MNNIKTFLKDTWESRTGKIFLIMNSILLLILFLSLLSISKSNSANVTQVDKLEKEKKEYLTKIENIESKFSNINSKYEELDKKHTKLAREHNDYKYKMEPYEQLQKEEEKEREEKERKEKEKNEKERKEKAEKERKEKAEKERKEKAEKERKEKNTLSEDEYISLIKSYTTELSLAGDDLLSLSSEVDDYGNMTNKGKDLVYAISEELNTASIILRGVKDEVVPPKQYEFDHKELLRADEHFLKASKFFDDHDISEDQLDLENGLNELQLGLERAEVPATNILSK